MNIKKFTSDLQDEEVSRLINDDLLGFIKSGKYRKPVLKIIQDKLVTPHEIATVLNTSLSQISRTLKELELQELIICNTPDRIKGKIYRITKKGINLLKYFEDD